MADLDWVMCGWRKNGECYLLVSERVVEATMYPVSSRMDFTGVADLKANFSRDLHAQLNAHVHGYIKVHGPTFAHCLAQILFGPAQWRPDGTYAQLTEAFRAGVDGGPAVIDETAIYRESITGLAYSPNDFDSPEGGPDVPGT